MFNVIKIDQICEFSRAETENLALQEFFDVVRTAGGIVVYLSSPIVRNLIYMGERLVTTESGYQYKEVIGFYFGYSSQVFWSR